MLGGGYGPFVAREMHLRILRRHRQKQLRFSLLGLPVRW